MADAMVRARLAVKSQMVLPKQVRDVLQLKPGDEFAFVIRDQEVRVMRVPARGDDPFACFHGMGFRCGHKGLCRALTGMMSFLCHFHIWIEPRSHPRPACSVNC